MLSFRFFKHHLHNNRGVLLYSMWHQNDKAQSTSSLSAYNATRQFYAFMNTFFFLQWKACLLFQSEPLYRQCRIKAGTMKRPTESPLTKPCCGSFRVAWDRVFCGSQCFWTNLFIGDVPICRALWMDCGKKSQIPECRWRSWSKTDCLPIQDVFAAYGYSPLLCDDG